MHCSEQYIISRHDNGWHIEIKEMCSMGQQINFASSIVSEDDPEEVYGFSKAKSLKSALLAAFTKYLRDTISGGLIIDTEKKPILNKENNEKDIDNLDDL